MFKPDILTGIIGSMLVILFLSVDYLYASDRTVYIVTADKGVMVSDNDGKSWDSFNKGLPSGCRAIRLYISDDEKYLSTYSSGIYRLVDNKWINISSDDFKKRSIYNKNEGYRKISAFSSDPDNSGNLVLATKHTIYRSTDSGKNWITVPMSGLHKRNYITAVAISGDKIFAGTSFNGVFELSGKEFKESGKGLPGEPYSDTLTFTEQVSYLYTEKSNLYAGFQFGGGIYYKSLQSRKYESISDPGDNSFNSIVYDIKHRNGKLYYSDGKQIFVKEGDRVEEFLSYKEIIDRISKRSDVSTAAICDDKNQIPSLSLWISNPEINPEMKQAAGKNAIYVSIPAIQKNIQKYIDIANKTDINTFVIDMKDDFGNVYFPTESTTAAEIKASKKPVNLKVILDKLKQNGIYAVARIVTFKDQKLFNAYNGKYAIKNRNTGAPWTGAKGEFWVDPYSQFVHNYNIELAVELEKAGFDEIQFDYIRFPSDGPIHLCKFSFQNDSETYKSEILIDFLKRAKLSLTIPVSVDIYGFNSWYYFGNWIGQDMEELSNTVDVICPMVYPSHFGSSFYKKYDREIRPYRIVRDGGLRAERMVNRSVILRPYLQAFNLLSPTWGPGYINHQINASFESGCSGYTLWNAKGDYDVPVRALNEKK